MAFRHLFTWGVAVVLAATAAGAEEPESWQGEPQRNPYAQQLLSPEFFRGTPVLDPQELPVGVVEQVILDVEKGQIAYLVVKSNGFWGVSDQTALVPWPAVQVLEGEDPRVVLQVSAGKLAGAPMNLQSLEGQLQEEQLHHYYGVSPYWENGTSQVEELDPDLHPTEELPQPMLQGGKSLTEGVYEPGSPEEEEE